MKYLLLFISIITLTLSCKNSNNKISDKTDKSITNKQIEIQKINAGVVYPKLNCTSNSSQSYALYLPKKYNDTILFPVLYFFDAQGEGEKTIKNYQTIADELNLIICASNNSKNGLMGKEIVDIFNNFTKEIRQNYKIDNSKQFALGFSGGARVAVQLALSDSQIKGVAGFGAGLPSEDFIGKISFDYAFGAGLQDLNFSELYQLHEILNNTQKEHYFLAYEGTHEWPPLDELKLAVLYLMIKSDTTKESQWLEMYKNEEEIALKQVLQNKDKWLEHLIYQRMAINLQSQPLQKKADAITKSNSYITHKQQLTEAIKIEKESKSIYSEMFYEADTEWWNKEIERIDGLIKSNSIKATRDMFLRIKGYLGLAIYMYSNNALKNNQLTDLQKFIFIYEKLEPKNPEVHYLKAIFYARQNNHNLAILSMEEAVKNGFKEFERIQQESSFKFSELELDFIRNANNQ